MWTFEPQCNGEIWIHRPDLESRLICLDDLIEQPGLLTGNEPIAYVLHHGGRLFTSPVTRLDAASLHMLREVVGLLPLLNRPLLDLAERNLALFPDREQFILCETAFFTDMPDEAAAYGLPSEMFEAGIRRYGAQGLLHEWVWKSFWADDPKRRIVSVALGDAPSLCAIRNGRALETSAGFTLAEGIPSIHACGTLDPAIPILLWQEGFSPPQIERLLLCQSGWQTFVQEERQAPLLKMLKEDDHALIAQTLMSLLLKEMGRCMAALASVDAVSFVCEDALGWMPFIVQCCERLRFCGVELREKRSKINGVWRLEAESSPCLLQVCEVRRADIFSGWVEMVTE